MDAGAFDLVSGCSTGASSIASLQKFWCAKPENLSIHRDPGSSPDLVRCPSFVPSPLLALSLLVAAAAALPCLLLRKLLNDHAHAAVAFKACCTAICKYDPLRESRCHARHALSPATTNRRVLHFRSTTWKRDQPLAVQGSKHGSSFIEKSRRVTMAKGDGLCTKSGRANDVEPTSRPITTYRFHDLQSHVSSATTTGGDLISACGRRFLHTLGVDGCRHCALEGTLRSPHNAQARVQPVAVRSSISASSRQRRCSSLAART